MNDSVPLCVFISMYAFIALEVFFGIIEHDLLTVHTDKSLQKLWIHPFHAQIFKLSFFCT